VQTTSVSADAPAAVAIVSRPAAKAETMELRVIRESPIAVEIDPIQGLVRWLARGSATGA